MDSFDQPKQIYDRLFEQSIDKIRSGHIVTDCYLKNPTKDQRRGISLIIKPNQQVIRKIELFQKDMKSIEPSQYYQPKSDLHITVLSLVSGYDGFSLNQINSNEYIELIQHVTQQKNNLKLNFTGITCTQEAVMIQGFPLNDTLKTIRQELRQAFTASELESSIDKRYTLKTAHITALRFMNPLHDPNGFARSLEKFREIEFGNFKVEQLYLVFNDWYQKQEKVKILKRFPLL